MKFAKQLEKSFNEQDIPDDWLAAAIQYKALKKCISKVVGELNFLGLEKKDLKLLFEDSNSDKVVEITEHDTNASNPLIAEYSLSKTKGQDHIIPILKINLDNQNFSDEHLQELRAQLKAKLETYISDDDHNKDQVLEIKTNGDEMIISPTSSREGTPLPQPETNKQVYIMLNSDTKFFQMLNEELDNLDNLRMKEEKKLISEVQDVSQEISKLSLSKRSMLSKQGDLYNWRKLFRIYLDSEVYFKYNETSSSKSEKNAQQIEKNLTQFIDNVNKSGILSNFKSKKSVVAFNDFVALNYHLLKILQFQYMNSEAFRKILKKFDKQTNLGIKYTFPKLISTDHIFITGTSIAQSICCIMQNSIVTLVPQLEDYTCPICMSVAYKPIKLQCSHTFCVRCLVMMKQQKKVDCPICRSTNAVVNADGANLDVDTMILMETYFPLEIKEKLKEREKEKYNQFVVGGVLKSNQNQKCHVS
jgi:E3 ubiquitin-protein ligase BAH